MAIEHRISQYDTLASLADKYLGDPDRWYEIVEYNNLDHPYIVEDTSEVGSSFASGYLTLQRKNYTNELHIPVGWTFQTRPAIIGGIYKVYEVAEEITIPAGQSVGYVYVKCQVRGVFGNTPAYTIIVPGREFNKANIQFNNVTNEQAFTNGRDGKVLTIGDSIYIPTEDGDKFIEPGDLQSIADLIGGEDLLLDPETGFGRVFTADGFGDIKSTSGLANIKQAINDRLMTEKGELPLHPEYGTNLPLIVGSRRTPYTDKLAEIEVYEALSYEDRITEVLVEDIRVEGTSVIVHISFKPSYGSEVASMDLSLSY